MRPLAGCVALHPVKAVARKDEQWNRNDEKSRAKAVQPGMQLRAEYPSRCGQDAADERRTDAARKATEGAGSFPIPPGAFGLIVHGKNLRWSG